MSIAGTPGDDVLIGTLGADTFILTKGGNDTALGLDGDDIFNMGAQLTAADHIRGGPGHDILVMEGNYSAGLTLAADTLSSIARIIMKAGFNYSLTTDDATVSAGAKLKVSAHALAAANHITFDGRAETDGAFRLVGGSGADIFKLGGAAVGAASSVSGGGGSDNLVLDGDWSGAASAPRLSGVETVQLLAGHDYNLEFADSAVTSGVLVIDGAALGAGDSLDVSEALETDRGYWVTGGAGDDTLTLVDTTTFFFSKFNGGAGSDTLKFEGASWSGVSLSFGALLMSNMETIVSSGGDLRLALYDDAVSAGQTLTIDSTADSSANGAYVDASAETNGHYLFKLGPGHDELTSGALSDTFDFTAAVDAVGVSDKITGFDFTSDVVKFHTVDSVDATSHAVGFGTVAADVSAACGGHGSNDWAELITVTGPGPYAGSYFLVVSDGTHSSGYQSGDLLIQLTTPANIGSIDVSDFIA